MSKAIASGCAAIIFAALPYSAVRAADQHIPAKLGIVKAGKLAKFVAKGATGFAAPLAGSSEDPTIHGAQLRFFDTIPGGAGDVTYTLDKTGWSGLGNPPGASGYKYKGSAALPPDATCTTASISATVIKATCKGVEVILTPPFSGNEGIVLGIPAVTDGAALRYCADLGGVTVRNTGAGLKRKNAPVPADCPFVAPTPSTTATHTATKTTTATATVTVSATATATRTVTPTRTATETATPTETWTPDPLVMAPIPRVVEATIHSIGLEWDILGGDGSHRATGKVCYRKVGDSEWLNASLPRVEFFSFFAGYTSYRGFNMFAGSLMFLDADTEYEVQLQAGNPAPACGTGDVFSVRTRPQPSRGAPGRTLYVKGDGTAQACSFVSPTGLPPGNVSSCDCAANPLAGGCNASICNGLTPTNAFVGFSQADECAQPADVFLVQTGTYKGHTFRHSGAPGQYISWVGDSWDSQQTRSQIHLTPGTGDEAGVNALVLEADDMWFEGLDLAPADGFEASTLGMAGIVGGLRHPDCAMSGGTLLPYNTAFAQCQATCQSDPNAHCDDYGTSDIVIVNNTISNFFSGIGTGKWCTSFGGHFAPVSWDSLRRSIHWDPNGICEGWSDTDGAIWGSDPSRMDEDRHRADMHRQWYVADNVITNNVGPSGAELANLSFLADSDIAYNRLSMTQQRSDWNTLKDKLLLPNCTLGNDAFGQIQWPTHAQCDFNGVMDQGACDLNGRHWYCPAEVEGWESAGYCYCVGPTFGVEPDAIFLVSSTNVDVYGNDVRDIPEDNFIQAGHSYSNLRVWRNRVMNAPDAFITGDPQTGAPWYIVRNEYVSWPGTHGDGTPPFAMFEFDRNVIVNNTFVVRGAAYAEVTSQFLLRAVSRNNLWIQEFSPTSNPGAGAIWAGQGSTYPGDPQGDEPGQSHSNWRTDVDYDGFDWDTLNASNVFWYPVDPPGGRSTFIFAPIDSPAQDSFQKWSRGCSGGPRDGLYCESDADCITSSIDYVSSNVGPIVAPDPGALFHCVYVEGHYSHVDKQNTFDLCVESAPAPCRSTIDAYALAPFSPDRLVLASGASSIDAGDPTFFAANQFFLNDMAPDGRSIVPYVTGVPDLGAYESGAPATHYGPRD